MRPAMAVVEGCVLEVRPIPVKKTGEIFAWALKVAAAGDTFEVTTRNEKEFVGVKIGQDVCILALLKRRGFSNDLQYVRQLPMGTPFLSVDGETVKVQSGKSN
jgi:hypothetical protein